VELDRIGLLIIPRALQKLADYKRADASVLANQRFSRGFFRPSLSVSLSLFLSLSNPLSLPSEVTVEEMATRQEEETPR